MGDKKFVCQFCQKEFHDAANLALHEDVCEKNINANHYQAQCKYCGKIFKNSTKANVFGGLKAHEISCQQKNSNINYKCQKCGSIYNTERGLHQHERKCNGSVKEKEYHKNCIFCGKEILHIGSLCSHEKYCKLNPNREKRIISTYNRHCVTPWNKGLTKNNDERIALITIKTSSTKEKLKREGKYINTGKASTIEKEKERRKKISQTMKGNPLAGGKRHGSGRGKKGWYKGYFCDSSWELAYVIYNIEHGIEIERNTEGFDYVFEGRKHKYYPDFKLSDGSYVEIKGAMTKQNKIKIDSFNGTLIVLGKEEIKPYLEYAVQKYGKDYIKLYESS